MNILVLQQLFIEAILDVFYFPLWWYTGGIKHALVWCGRLFNGGNDWLAPSLWLKNIFVPMYGQYDISGRMISFFMRLVQVIFRSIALMFFGIFCLLLFVVWLVLPIVAGYWLYLSLV